ncbi:hypothetical protein [Microvirga puerhi]|uniref:Uncharacterized protein n=1 Tax=Microvirga puerhi TaxID=2876078 RepID=A0ABS7VSV0_9HYPH|nr:hypothetical protein [Microvirga puerhi]MBZ6078614.1 hypothetical protein [Microvirga puerhi]
MEKTAPSGAGHSLALSKGGLGTGIAWIAGKAWSYGLKTLKVLGEMLAELFSELFFTWLMRALISVAVRSFAFFARILTN